MRGVKSRLCLPLRRAALSVEEPTANGQAPAHHHTHGRMATVGMDKTGVHQALIDHLVAGTTGDQTMTTDPLHHRHRENGDLIGATAQKDQAIFPQHREMVVTHFLMHLAMVLTDAIADAMGLMMMSTSRVTVAPGDHESQMTDKDAVRETRAIRRTGHQMSGKTATEATATETEIGIGLASLETLVGTGETAGPGLEVRIGGTGIVITGTTTFIAGVSRAGEEVERGTNRSQTAGIVLGDGHIRGILRNHGARGKHGCYTLD